MESPWHFGNTTVRNPLRIRNGLIALYDSSLNGNIIGKGQEKLFAEILDNAHVVAIIDKSRDYSDMGRKWRSCFSQLGFITHKFSRNLNLGETEPIIKDLFNRNSDLNLSGLSYEITPNGKRLIEAESLQQQQECFLRALLAYEIPSIIEEKNGAHSFKPFYFVLQVLSYLEGETHKGLSMLEMAYLETQRTHSEDDIKKIINFIKNYRREYSNAKGTVAKRSVDKVTLSRITEGMDIKPETLMDYADLNFRYLRYTGLVSFKGRGLVLNNNKTPIIDAILDLGVDLIGKNDLDYLERLWMGSRLPTDSESQVNSEIGRYKKLLIDAGYKLEDLPQVTQTATIADINQVRIRLEELYQEHLEICYAKNQCERENLEEIIAYLKKLDGQRIDGEYDLEIDDKPAFFEWAVWRAFLAINNLKNQPYEARHFKVDQDFYPIGCAPSRGPDMLFVFDDYALVVEVTLKSSSRQEAAEGEPVRRHVADEKIKIAESYSLPVYGLFIAGTIDNNTAETFRIGVWYNGDEPDFINIVPITIKQLIILLDQFFKNHFDSNDFRRLLDSCLIQRNAHAPAWKVGINECIRMFITG